MCVIVLMILLFCNVLRCFAFVVAFLIAAIAAWLSLHIVMLLSAGVVIKAVAMAANSALVDDGKNVILPLKFALGQLSMCHANSMFLYLLREPSVYIV